MGKLIEAIEGHNPVLLEQLLSGEYQSSPLINTEIDKTGNCALIIAAKMGFTQALNLLLQHGAHVNQLNTKNKLSAIHAAATYNEMRALIILLTHVNTLNAARITHAKVPSADLMNQPIQSSYNKDAAIARKGYTALHTASEQGFDQIVRLLLENRAYVNQRLGKQQAMPLHLAVAGDHIDTVIELIKAGADLNAIAQDPPTQDSTTNTSVSTPLHIAVRNNNPEMIKLLIRPESGHPGAFMDSLNHECQTPLDLAKALDHKASFQALLAADTKILDTTECVVPLPLTPLFSVWMDDISGWIPGMRQQKNTVPTLQRPGSSIGFDPDLIIRQTSSASNNARGQNSGGHKPS